MGKNKLSSRQAAVWVNGSHVVKIAAGSYEVRYINEKYFEKIEIHEAKIKRLQKKEKEKKKKDSGTATTRKRKNVL